MNRDGHEGDKQHHHADHYANREITGIEIVVEETNAKGGNDRRKCSTDSKATVAIAARITKMPASL